jgi:hypothetical protein
MDGNPIGSVFFVLFVTFLLRNGKKHSVILPLFGGKPCHL